MSLKKTKKVCFDNVTVIFYVKLECKTYRNRFWEIIALDRTRFKDRINQYESILSPVLNSLHREGVYAKLQKNETFV